MTNPFEAVQAAEKFLDDLHLAVTGVVDNVFVVLDEALDRVKDRLPEAEEVDVNTPPTEPASEVSKEQMLSYLRDAFRKVTGKPATSWDRWNPTGPFGEALLRDLYKQARERTGVFSILKDR